MNIKQLLSACILGTAIASCSFPSTEREGIVINLQEKGAEIALSMYGVFFEEINHAGDGGLYAELVQNRSFEEHEMPACLLYTSDAADRQGIMWKEIN